MVKNSAVIQAAGKGSRFHSENYKLLFPVEGMPLIVKTLGPVLRAGFDEIIVVIGCHADRMRETLQDLPVKIVENKDWKKGQSTSLSAGVRAVSGSSERACLMLGDQPFLKPETLKALLAESAARPGEVIVPVCRGKRGNPTVVPACHFRTLLDLTEGDTGGKRLLETVGYRSLSVDDPGILRDVDSVRDLDKQTGCGL